MLYLSLSPSRKMIVMVSTMLALFVVSINQTVFSTALPRILGDLGGFGLLSWLFTSYMLTSTIIVPLVGKLSDLYGRKPLIMIGIALFMAASAIAGLSQDMLQLVIYRGLQGVGAGMVFANAFAIIGDIFSPSERSKYQGLFAAVFGVSSVIGPTIGGAITDHLSWRWVFYVNIPIGVVALAVLWRSFPWLRQQGAKPKIDYYGAAALTIAVVPLLLALVWAGDLYPWNSAQIVGLMALSAVGVAIFVFAENRAQEPLLPLFLFRNRIFAVANTVNFLRGIVIIGTISFIPMYMQGVLDVSATNSGIVVMPLMLAMVVGNIIAGQMVSRTGKYRLPIIVSGAIAALGMFLLAQMDESTDNATTVRNMVVLGLGLGIGMPVINTSIQNAVPHRLLGVASSSLPFFFQIGGTLGVAVYGTMINTHLHDNLRTELPPEVAGSIPSALLPALEDPQTLLSPERLEGLRNGFQAIGAEGPRLFEEALSAMRIALSDAIVLVFFLTFLIAIVTLAISFLLPDVPSRYVIPSEGEAPMPAGLPRQAAVEPLAESSNLRRVFGPASLLDQEDPHP